jgi:hypothetical protein
MTSDAAVERVMELMQPLPTGKILILLLAWDSNWFDPF